MGGAACGLVLPLIFTPMELIKVQRQVLQDNHISTWTIARRLWRSHGVSGLYTGLQLTVARSTLGNAALFGSFEAWKAILGRAMARDASAGETIAASLNSSDTSWGTHVAAGVLSGWTTQALIFPIDAAKSRLQAGVGAGDQAGRKSVLSALAALWQEGAMYRGISANLLRVSRGARLEAFLSLGLPTAHLRCSSPLTTSTVSQCRRAQAVPVHMAYLPVFGLLMSTINSSS